MFFLKVIINELHGYLDDEKMDQLPDNTPDGNDDNNNNSHNNDNNSNGNSNNNHINRNNNDGNSNGNSNNNNSNNNNDNHLQEYEQEYNHYRFWLCVVPRYYCLVCKTRIYIHNSNDNKWDRRVGSVTGDKLHLSEIRWVYGNSNNTIILKENNHICRKCSIESVTKKLVIKDSCKFYTNGNNQQQQVFFDDIAWEPVQSWPKCFHSIMALYFMRKCKKLELQLKRLTKQYVKINNHTVKGKTAVNRWKWPLNEQQNNYPSNSQLSNTNTNININHSNSNLNNNNNDNTIDLNDEHLNTSTNNTNNNSINNQINNPYNNRRRRSKRIQLHLKKKKILILLQPIVHHVLQ